jgi:hypothetical protein
MYLDLLAPTNTEFVAAIDRSFPRFRSKKLDQVVAALQAAKVFVSATTLAAVITTLHQWRIGEPKEFANRGGTAGVAFRLWMEAKQLIRNRFGQMIAYADPQMPPLCPGVMLLNVYVPEAEGHIEICHGFAYRWAIASGMIQESPHLRAAKSTAYNAQSVPPALYPLGSANYPAARVGGAMQLHPGDIVAMFTRPPPQGGLPALGHSLVAETPTIWFSANNAGTFGVGTGRSRINTAQPFGIFGGHQVGWIGATNQWRRPDGIIMDVIYRR